MLSERHDRRKLKLGQLLDARKKEIDDHDSGRRRLNSEVRIYERYDRGSHGYIFANILFFFQPT